MAERLKGKGALITGAGSGIGLTMAVLFAREGCAGYLEYPFTNSSVLLNGYSK